MLQQKALSLSWLSIQIITDYATFVEVGCSDLEDAAYWAGSIGLNKNLIKNLSDGLVIILDRVEESIENWAVVDLTARTLVHCERKSLSSLLISCDDMRKE